jgi:hypothetical protein
LALLFFDIAKMLRPEVMISAPRRMFVEMQNKQIGALAIETMMIKTLFLNCSVEHF